MGRTLAAVRQSMGLHWLTIRAKVVSFCASPDLLPSPLSHSWVEEQRRIELSKVEYEGPVWKWPVS